MKTTLIFPSYMHLAGFISVADNGNIEMDIHKKTLTANFHEEDIQKALLSFNAVLVAG